MGERVPRGNVKSTSKKEADDQPMQDPPSIIEADDELSERPLEPALTGPALLADRETELFNKFLAGSDEAYRTLYDAFERPLYTYCCKLLGNDVIAQDIFQDVWIRMFRLRGEQRQVRKFSGLLFTIARNLSLNSIRDSKASMHVSLEDMPPESELFMRTMEFDEGDLREMMQKALQQLPINQREAFVLREYSGYSYNEIAEITGATMINVKTRAWRAKERLRKVISAWMDLRNTE
jgi:RNA polymerase sigma-70 factor (ECF subfamily)